jgi:hypothetical protein
MTLPGGVVPAEVEALTLGYTFLQADDQRRIVVPNSLMAGQVTVHVQQTQAQL